ncbi:MULTISPECIES: glucose 1-dehydrogenase [unclassified Methylibium]|jgi:3(or 17)beta-hydroxysteroid dehydrogenase|uniref:glucose 1-dehydrogenase n=1 Tax=unclassified Methylibium TaxID=2633235 RepID=UPI0003F3FF21|nr:MULTISPECIES: glucose 1-dehydrogenase [unclassified Methylibium]EWS53120.1 Cyclopentanol dehydrogenase [Methylibium sp. T29]EWS57780.1 Cyclopentanol dehydrogenase [Methylibium sp. T29-B]
MGRVDNKVALVTGGAKGIGRASALMLAREGARVVLTDVEEAQGTAVAKEIERAGGKALFLVQDVTDESQWVDVVDRARAHFGGLNIVVNNAGIGTAGSAEDETLEAWRRLMAVNLDGVFLGTKHAIRAMKDEAGAGSIINISSIEGIVADPKLAAYNASKGGVRIFSKSAALHCAQAGYRIRVNTIHPGYIWTPMVEGYLTSLGDVEGGRQVISKMHPIGRMGEPDDIAYGVLYLGSDESSFMTGSELVIDGGYTAQ